MANIKWQIILKTISVILVLILVNFLLFKYYFGKKQFVYNFVSTLPGSEKYTSINGDGEMIKTEGVILKNKVNRFDLKNDSEISKAIFKITYKTGQKEIKLGIRNNESDLFLYKSVYFDLLNNLTWDKITDNELVLFQKNKTFDSIKSFLVSIPMDKKIGTYQVETDKLAPYIIENSNEKSNLIINTPIRGSASILILVKNKTLNVKVSKQDMNMYEGNDILNIALSKNGNVVYTDYLPDDGFSDNSQNQTAPQAANLSIDNLNPGLYKLDLTFDSPNTDSVIKSIEINQNKVMFMGSILTWNNTSAEFYTKSKTVKAFTSWTESIQSLKLDDKIDLAITDTKTKFLFDLKTDEMHKIFIPKGNVNFGTGGYFSISPDNYFDPKLINAQEITVNTSKTTIDNSFEYILSTVKAPITEGDWLTSEIEFEISKSNQVFFSLEIPDIEKSGGSLEIKNLSITLQK